MTVEHSAFTFTWIDNWVRIPDSPSTRKSGRTQSITTTTEGNIVIFNQADPAVLVYSPVGELLHAWGNRYSGAHGITLVNECGIDYLFLVDEHSCEVTKTTLDGQRVLDIQPPDHHNYQSHSYIPTWVAVHESRFGGHDDIYVADGYGASLVHRYDRNGNYITTISGVEGAGHFDCPHGLAFRYDRANPELYIADRGNERIQVFDAECRFIRAIEETCHSPCSLTFYEGHTYIPELFTGIKILDEADQLVTSIGDNDGISTAPGWPNLQGTDYIQPELFNSPHDLTLDAHGNIFVVEWIIGGRITKLEKTN